MSDTNFLLEAFRDFARRYSIACRHADNMAKRGRNDDLDDAISAKQEIEQEFCASFCLVRTPARSRA